MFQLLGALVAVWLGFLLLCGVVSALGLIGLKLLHLLGLD